jgi:hypothetical protein
MDINMQKVLFAAVAITMIATAFYGGMEYQKSQPADIVIVGVNASDELVQSDILPITEEHGIRFPVSQTVTEYRLTYGH